MDSVSGGTTPQNVFGPLQSPPQKSSKNFCCNSVPCHGHCYPVDGQGHNIQPDDTRHGDRDSGPQPPPEEYRKQQLVAWHEVMKFQCCIGLDFEGPNLLYDLTVAHLLPVRQVCLTHS